MGLFNPHGINLILEPADLVETLVVKKNHNVFLGKIHQGLLNILLFSNRILMQPLSDKMHDEIRGQ